MMDSTAISLCMDNGMPIVVFNMNQYGNIKRGDGRTGGFPGAAGLSKRQCGERGSGK